jgi:hypothetical protein
MIRNLFSKNLKFVNFKQLRLFTTKPENLGMEKNKTESIGKTIKEFDKFTNKESGQHEGKVPEGVFHRDMEDNPNLNKDDRQPTTGADSQCSEPNDPKYTGGGRKINTPGEMSEKQKKEFAQTNKKQ